MIALKALLVAQTVIVDAQTNNTSVINLVEELGVFAFPAALPPFTVFALLERDPLDAPARQARVRILLDRSELAALDLGLNFTTFKRTRGIFRVEGFVVPAPGALRFVLEDGARELGSYSFDVFVAPKPHSAPPPSGDVN